MDHNRAANDVFFLSWPKSGRTWQRVLVGHYLCGLLGCEPRMALRTHALTSAAGLKRAVFTHNGSSPTYLLPASHRLVANPEEWRGRDVMLLVRDPRDILVSAYHHMTKREPLFSGSISEFIRTPAIGVEKLAVSWDRWNRNRLLAERFSVIHYASMHENPAIILRQSLRFLGVDKLDEALIEEAVIFTSFENLRALEQEGYFAGSALSRARDPAAAKVRNGEIGSYVDALSPEDCAFIERRIKAIGDPFGTLSTDRGQIAA